MPEDYQPRPTQVAGYRALSDQEINAVNATKAMENAVAQWWHEVRDTVPDVDHDWLDRSRDHFHHAFMALVRAVARPRDPFEGNNT